MHARVLLHRVDDVAALVADRLQRGPGDVGVGVVARQPDDRPARVGAPVGREQAGEGRHEVDPAVVVDRARQRLALRGVADDLELVAQPLDRRARDGDRALQRVHRLGVAELVADGGQQAVLGADELLAGVQQQEVAGAVGVLGLARREAHLPDHGRVLVAEDAGDRDLALPDAAPGALRAAEEVRVRGRPDLGQHLRRHAEDLEQLGVPREGLEVHQHRARGVGDVGQVDAALGAAGHVPQQPGVHRAEDDVARLGRLADPVDLVEDPLELAAREVGRRRQPGTFADQVGVAVPLQRGGDRVGPGVLPDDRVVAGPARPAVPHDGGLALVRDAHGGQVGRVGLRAAQGLLGHRPRALPDLVRVVLDPARARHDLLVLELVAGDLATVVVEDHAAGAGGSLVERGDELRHGATVARLRRAASRVGDQQPSRTGGPPMTVSRGFAGRRRGGQRTDLPPGQYDEGAGWPVLTAEVTPAPRPAALVHERRRPGRHPDHLELGRDARAPPVRLRRARSTA